MIKEIQLTAMKYGQRNGFDTLAHIEAIASGLTLDTDRACRLADVYEASEHAPFDPFVRNAYSALRRELFEQYAVIMDTGIKVEMWQGKGEPYASSKAMFADVSQGHLFYLKTEVASMPENHPMVGATAEKDSAGNWLCLNDVFRIVHDLFGHVVGLCGFGERGEEKAWRVHSAIFSLSARHALTAETRGQNSWVNFGKHVRNKRDEIAPRNRPFAEQKACILMTSEALEI